MTQQNDNPAPRSKFPQYIVPVIILLLAAGAAIYGVMWSQSDESSTAQTDETTQADPNEVSADLEEVEQEFPEADPTHQEALATARGEMQTYFHSEFTLNYQLTDSTEGYAFDQDAADFALEHLGVNWDEEAAAFATAIMNENPDLEPEELETILQDDPQGPQYTEEQTQYALSQVN